MVTTPLLWQGAIAVSPFNSADQIDPDIVQFANGNIAVAWTDTAGADEILFSVYDPLGDLVHDSSSGYLEALAMSGTGGDQGDVDLVAYADGGFGAVYEVDAPDDSDDIEYTAWNADFTSAFRFYVEADPHPDRPNFEDPIIARSSTSGHIFVNFLAWQLTTEGDAVPYSYYRMYDPAGGTLSGRASTSGSSSTFDSNYDGQDVAALANGEFVLAQANSIYDTLPSYVGLTYFDEFGNYKSSVQVNVDTVNSVFDPDLAPLTGGDVAVAWVKSTGGQDDIRARVMDASGNPVSGPIDVVSGVGHQSDPVATSLGDGGFVVFWDDVDALKGQRFDAAGAKVGFEFVVVNSPGSLEASNLAATRLADGRIAVTWQLEFGVNEVQMAIWDPRDEENPGTAGDDLIIGTPHTDFIPLTGGRDHVVGWDGADVIVANFTTGAIFDGGDGQDFAKFDWIDSPDHDKWAHIIDLEQGFAKWEGDGGQSELLDFEHADGTYFFDVILGTEDDNILSGLGGNDFLHGEEGADILNGGSGDDTLFGGPGGWRGDTPIGDNLDGGSGTDTAGYAGSDAGVVVSLFTGMAAKGHADRDTLVSIENLTGSAFDDLLTGSNGENSLVGGKGDDQLFGRDAVDALLGGGGDDFLAGGNGDDELDGGDGEDTIIGGTGNDSLYGGINADHLDGSSGDDIIYGHGQGDLIYGSAGADLLDGGIGNDTLYGGDGNDQLYGDDNSDTVVGSAGDDTLDGGTGIDQLTGGADADTFVFADGYQQDQAAGFEDDLDTIRFDDALWGGGMTAAQVLADHATQTTPGIVTFDFGGGDTLEIVNGAGITVAALENDILII